MLRTGLGRCPSSMRLARTRDSGIQPLHGWRPVVQCRGRHLRARLPSAAPTVCLTATRPDCREQLAIAAGEAAAPSDSVSTGTGAAALSQQHDASLVPIPETREEALVLLEQLQQVQPPVTQSMTTDLQMFRGWLRPNILPALCYHASGLLILLVVTNLSRSATMPAGHR